MSKQQELIDKCLEIANQGGLTKEAIKSVIKQDFRNQLSSGLPLMKIYDKLAKKYGKSTSHIMTLCN